MRPTLYVLLTVNVRDYVHRIGNNYCTSDVCCDHFEKLVRLSRFVWCIIGGAKASAKNHHRN